MFQSVFNWLDYLCIYNQFFAALLFSKTMYGNDLFWWWLLLVY